jgi:hypothetical protein
MSKFGLCLSLSVPSTKLCQVGMRMTTIPPYLSLSGHNTGDSRSRTPKSASKAKSAIEAFDITDLSRSETAREEGRCDIQFVQCLRGFDDKRNEPSPPFPCEHLVSKASRNTRSLSPAFLCVEVIFNAFLTSASVRQIWHGV